MSWFPSLEKSKFNICSVMNLFGQYWVVHYQFDLSSKIVWKIIWVEKNMPFHELLEGKVGDKLLNKEIQWNVCNSNCDFISADVAQQFQYAVRVIGSNFAPTVERDEFLVAEKIKKECKFILNLLFHGV